MRKEAMASHGAGLPRFFRGAASCFTIAAGVLMINAHQTTYLDGSVVHAEFDDLPPYWCFIFVNFIIAAYSLLLICLPSKSQLWKLAVSLDLLLTVILIGSCSAVLAIGIMESKGNPHAFWLPICHIFRVYCFRVYLAVALGLCGSFSYIMVLLICMQKEFNTILLEA